MARFGKVVKAAGRVVITPAKIADNFVLNVAADGGKYLLTKAVPPSWVWNRVPAGVKTALKNQLLDHTSRTRVTLDSFVTAALGLAIADKAAGPEVAIYREIAEFYANNRLLAAGATLAGVGYLTSFAMRKARYYVVGGVVGAALMLSSVFVQHPVGIRGAEGRPPIDIRVTKNVTQYDLENYVTNTLLPQIDERIKSGQLSKEDISKAVNEGVEQYVKDVLTPELSKTIGKASEDQIKALQMWAQVYVQTVLAQSGYATASDLATTNTKIGDLGKKVDDLASRLQQPQLTPTAIPPTATPTPAPPKPGQLEQYLQSTGYVVPADTLKAAAKANLTGLASALSLPAETLTAFTDGSDANGEFVQLVVTSSGVTARANYGASAGQRDTPQPKTNQLALSVYLQSNLTPAQLNAITPVK